MSGSKYSFKDDARKQIIEASEILKRKAIEITNDLDDEKVNEIYITISISVSEPPTLDIQKTYIPINEEDYEWLQDIRT